MGSLECIGGVKRGKYGALLNEETMKIEKCTLSMNLAELARW